MLISLETYRTCDFPDGGSGYLDPRMRMIDPLASSVKPIRRTGFLMQRFIFHCSSDYMMGYIILDILSGSGTLNGISMH